MNILQILQIDLLLNPTQSLKVDLTQRFGQNVQSRLKALRKIRKKLTLRRLIRLWARRVIHHLRQLNTEPREVVKHVDARLLASLGLAKESQDRRLLYLSRGEDLGMSLMEGLVCPLLGKRLLVVWQMGRLGALSSIVADEAVSSELGSLMAIGCRRRLQGQRVMIIIKEPHSECSIVHSIEI